MTSGNETERTLFLQPQSNSWPEVVTKSGCRLFCYWGQFILFLFCVPGVCLFACCWLSVPAQLIAWKDSSLKWPIMCRVGC